MANVVDDWQDRYATVPSPVIEAGQKMLAEKNYTARDNYRRRLEDIISFCQYALRLDMDDRAKRRAAKR